MAVMLVAAGIFFVSQDLGAADQYASVASFFLALILGAISILRRRQPPRPKADSGQRELDGPRRLNWVVNLLFGNKYVQIGDGSTMNVNGNQDKPVRKRRRR
jgi:hypothetical protein